MAKALSPTETMAKASRGLEQAESVQRAWGGSVARTEVQGQTGWESLAARYTVT